jgi:transcriptional regulator with XRE-family HTH domain
MDAKFRAMEYSPEALGQVIRELREARTPKLSQEELGRKAGYRTGAGVSMSRIENGVTRPGPTRLEGIANTLGLTLQELETRGAQRSNAPGRPDGHRLRAGRVGPVRAGTPVTGRDRESTKDRMRRIQGDFDRRNTQAVTNGLAFNAAHDRARDDFFMELVRSARTITGIPAPPTPAPVSAQHGISLSPTAEAALRRQVAAHGITATLASGAGAAAADDEADHESAYSAVVAAAMLTPVPSPAAQPDPRAGATARATRALLGGGTTHAGATGIAAGTALLAGFVASAASPLIAAGTLAWLARRSRRQNDRLRIELDQAEANLAATQRGFDAVMDILARATEPLSYIAVHASHAHRRWQKELPDTPMRWSDLSESQQRQYEAFVEVAACQVCVDSINMTELLAAPSEQQARLIQVADDILTLAQQDVEILV